MEGRGPAATPSAPESAARMNRFYEEWLRQVEQEFESEEILRRFLRAFTAPERFWEPQADVYETREAVKIKVELAGVRPGSIHVELSGDCKTLAIRGFRQDECADAVDRILFHQMEIYLGPFERVLPLPHTAELDRERLEAEYRDGFLTITLPKLLPAPPVTHRVQVTASE